MDTTRATDSTDRQNQSRVAERSYIFYGSEAEDSGSYRGNKESMIVSVFAAVH